MSLQHIAQRIVEREIEIDAEYCQLLANRCDCDTAIILGLKRYCDDLCYAILIVRNNIPITIEMRRKSQNTTTQTLGVSRLVKLNLSI